MKSDFKQQASRTEGKRNEKRRGGASAVLSEMKGADLSRRRETARKRWRHSLLAGVSLLQREKPQTEHSEREGKKSVGVSEHGMSLSLPLPPSEPPHSRPLAPSLPSTLLLCVTVRMSPEQEDDDEPD